MNRLVILSILIFVLALASLTRPGLSISSPKCPSNEALGQATNALNVYKQARSVGESRALQDLQQDKSKWHTFTEGLSCGDQSWIDVGILLAPHANGVAKQEIQLAFQEALVQAPDRVLTSLTGQLVLLRMACGPSGHLTYDLATSSTGERQSAVMSLYQPERRHRAPTEMIDKCMASLEKADAGLAEKFRKGK